jgi:hypothetical protein
MLVEFCFGSAMARDTEYLTLVMKYVSEAISMVGLLQVMETNERFPERLS